jgi:hypothetical protein
MVDVLVVRRMVLRRGRCEREFDLDGKTWKRCCNGDRKVVDGWKGRSPLYMGTVDQFQYA